MAIPPLNDHGLLPDGIHDCTMEEAEERFGVFRSSGRRSHLWVTLAELMGEARACGLVDAVLIDGSFVIAEPAPNDIELILVAPPEHDFSADFQPSEYNVLSKRQVNRRFGFDLLVARADSEEYRRSVSFFQQVRLDPGRRKGILRIRL